ncbi:MAG: endonuclease/exonuclease/phosphatase family protein [Novosphingobium aromaticivorans]|nr:endonuclease/exonuclease/phosphatase family protein [Novosphingobium aromaticivorans]
MSRRHAVDANREGSAGLMNKYWKIGIIAPVLVLIGSRHPSILGTRLTPAAEARFDGSLSVLTYNVKGLPWPVALGRNAALESIATRLRDMRLSGRAPQIVVLQEAFTGEAQAIGAAAGYRVIVSGPGADTPGSTTMSAADRAYASRARWWKGETEGKFVGSGLQILSDYPVESVHRLAFPAFACAGYDCLANKGAVLATLNIPGMAMPVDVFTTHLNSRRASGVEDDRTIYAYRRQVGSLTQFIRANHDPRNPLIVAGDFNVGSAPPRRTVLFTQVRTNWTSNGPIRDAFDAFQQRGGVLGQDAAWSFRRARDWQFFSGGTAASLELTGIEVPFGRERSGGMLSDHVGYTVHYRLRVS